MEPIEGIEAGLRSVGEGIGDLFVADSDASLPEDVASSAAIAIIRRVPR